MARLNFENTFAAAAFAEAGEHETAMKMAGIKPVFEKVRKLADTVQQCFAAVGFAEAGCHDEAARMVHTEQVCRKNNETLDSFLENVGLSNVRVCYGLARV